MIFVGGRQPQIASALLGHTPRQHCACNLWDQDVLKAVFLSRVGEDAVSALDGGG